MRFQATDIPDLPSYFPSVCYIPCMNLAVCARVNVGVISIDVPRFPHYSVTACILLSLVHAFPLLSQ